MHDEQQILSQVIPGQTLRAKHCDAALVSLCVFVFQMRLPISKPFSPYSLKKLPIVV